MTNKKFKLGELVERDGRLLRRLVALRNFDGVREGDQGGLIETEDMLNSEDNSWVYSDSVVYGEGSYISGNSKIYGHSTVVESTIEDSVVRNHSWVENSFVRDDSDIHNNSAVVSSTLNNSVVRDESRVENSDLRDSYTFKSSNVYASILDDARLVHNSQVTRSKLDRVRAETLYIQDTRLADIDESYSAYIDGERTQLESFGSAELGQYDEHNVHELLDNHRVETVELSDDDLSDLNEHTIQQSKGGAIQ